MIENINTYLNDHIAYRLNCLMAWDIMVARQPGFEQLDSNPYKDSLILVPAFELSLIMGRVLLNFIGISYNNQTFKLKQYVSREQDDITLIKLFPNRLLCNVDDEDLQKQHVAVSTLLKLSNKSTAHLTSTYASAHELELLPIARRTIYELVLKYVPEIRRDKLWFNQVSSVKSV